MSELYVEYQSAVKDQIRLITFSHFKISLSDSSFIYLAYLTISIMLSYLLILIVFMDSTLSPYFFFFALLFMILICLYLFCIMTILPLFGFYSF